MAEDRQISAKAETRRANAAREKRTISADVESRTVHASAENRTVTMKAPRVPPGHGSHATRGLVAGLFIDLDTFFAPVVERGGDQALLPSFYADEDTFFDATVDVGNVDLAPSLFDDTDTFYVAVVLRVGDDFLVESARFDDMDTFYSATVTCVATIAPSIFADADTFFAPIVGGLSLRPSLFTNSNTFYAARVGNFTLLPPLFANSNTFHSATVAGSVPAGAIVLNPGDNVASIVNAAAIGAVFYFNAGTYRGVTLAPKNSQTFIGADGAILNGSAVLTAWVASGGRWQIGGQTQQGPVHPNAEFMPGTQRPGYPEAVYRDNVPLVPKDSLANLTTGSFFLDYATDTLYLFDNPSGHVIEAGKQTDAFHGSATNVTIQNLIVEKYGPQIQDGAINAGVGWIVKDCEVRLNYSVGISMRGNGGQILRNYVHDNGEMGLQGGSFNAGTPAFNILIESNELANNGFWSFIDPLWEGGGFKFTNTDGLIVRDNYAHDNNGTGLWTDINNINTLYEFNVSSRNTINGVSHEISYAAIIHNNTFWGNGFGDARGWGFGADVNIQTSKNVQVYGNRIEATGGHNPLVMVQQNRGTGTHGVYECTGNNIHDNIVVNHDADGSVGGFVDFNAAAMTGGGNVWANNSYYMTDFSGRFEWNGGKTFAQFVTATGETGTRSTSFPDTSGWPTGI